LHPPLCAARPLTDPPPSTRHLRWHRRARHRPQVEIGGDNGVGRAITYSIDLLSTHRKSGGELFPTWQNSQRGENPLDVEGSFPFTPSTIIPICLTAATAPGNADCGRFRPLPSHISWRVPMSYELHHDHAVHESWTDRTITYEIVIGMMAVFIF